MAVAPKKTTSAAVTARRRAVSVAPNDEVITTTTAARSRRTHRVGGRSARVVRDVLAASLEAFVEHGYAGLSIEDVASRARVNKTTIYRRWPTRAELIREALLSLRPEEHSVPNTGSVREDLFVFLKQRAQMLGTPYRRAIAQALLLSGGDPELQAVMERIRRDRPLVPSSLFERAIERGELPAQIDLQLFIDVLLGPLHLRTYWRQEPVTDQFLRDLVDLVVHGANTQRTIAPR